MHDGSSSRSVSPTASTGLLKGDPSRQPRFLSIPPLIIDLEDPGVRNDSYIRLLLEQRGL